MPRASSAETRQRILDVASGLFYRHGVRAVGMDRIIADCDIGKMTLYRQFPTKDDLVVACLRARQDDWWARIDNARAAADDDPADQLVAIIDAVEAEICAPGYGGCPFLNTLAEYPDTDHPAHTLIVGHVDRIRDQLRQLSRAAGAADPEQLADILLVLCDGMLANAAALGPQPAQRAANLARQLITTTCHAQA